MSRLASLSPAALKAMFSPDADSTLLTLLTISGDGITAQRLADGYTQRLSETADDVLYGVVSRSQNYIFLPFEITLPAESQDTVPSIRVTFHDITRHLIPILRTITTALDVKIELVLSNTPDVVEVEFPGFMLGGITYNKDTITAELSVESLAAEPFPAHTFTPSYFPGLF